jgi:RNA polymerase sigma factor (sigma-70 family)
MNWSAPTPATDESAQWSAFRTGDRQAFSAIFRTHYRSLFSYGMKIKADECLVEDSIQDLFFDLWRTRESLTGQIASVRFYLMQCLRRRMLRTNGLEKRSRQAHPQAEIYEESATHSEERMHIEADIEHTTRRVLNFLIDALPDRQREVMYLRFFQELSLEEIAEIMAINKQSVKNLIYRSVNTLRENPALAQIFYSLTWLALLLMVLQLFQ